MAAVTPETGVQHAALVCHVALESRQLVVAADGAHLVHHESDEEPRDDHGGVGRSYLAEHLAVHRAESLRERATRAGLLLAGAALAIAPVTLHNLRAGDLVLITSQAGQNFYIGNFRGNDTLSIDEAKIVVARTNAASVIRLAVVATR